MFHKVATLALAKRCLSNEHRSSILMTFNTPDLGSASDWLKALVKCPLFSQATRLIDPKSYASDQLGPWTWTWDLGPQPSVTSPMLD